MVRYWHVDGKGEGAMGKIKYRGTLVRGINDSDLDRSVGCYQEGLRFEGIHPPLTLVEPNQSARVCQRL